MTQSRSSKPEFYRTFMREGFFPNSNKRIKYQESTNFWVFKAGSKVYKVKKKEDTTSSVPLEQIFCQELERLTAMHSGSLELTTATVKKEEDAYIFDETGSSSGELLYYAVVMNQLSDRAFLEAIMEKGRLNKTTLYRVVDFLFEFHQKTAVDESKSHGTPEELTSKLQNLYYQSKKYLGDTITQPVIDMTFRPMERFLEEHRKMFLRRIKKGCIKHVHGSFIPKKINVSKEEVVALGKSTDPLRDRYLDFASDIADIVVELNHADHQEFATTFISKYSKLSGDRELKQIVPFYQALKCLANGLAHSVIMETSTGEQVEEHRQLAIRYYEQTVDAVRQF